MTEKEVAEIRRRFRPEKSNITHIRGCYVNDRKEIVSQFVQSLAITPEEETANILSLLKKTLSGNIGKNLIDISFDTKQVVDSDEHRLLMALRNSELKDEDAVQALYQRVMDSLVLEGHYMILLAYDAYDVPYRSKSGEKLEDASSEVFPYILCSICPIKMTKPALGYYIVENAFHNLKQDWAVSPPELGFLFPAFDDRSANIYGALYYSRDTTENHKEFVDAIFRQEVPMPPAEQKETFQSILAESLAEDCQYQVVQTVHDQLCEMITEHKVNKEEEPLTISKHTVKSVLEACGVSDEHLERFEENYNAEFGDATISPRNLVDHRQFEVKTPNVTIRISNDRNDLVETRTIDGIPYIMIRAEEGVEVNGVAIQIP